MKRIPVFLVCCAIALLAASVSAQVLPDNILQEMQRGDPQAAQELSRAIQKGDFLTAQKIYLDFKNKPAQGPAPAAEPRLNVKPSLFERTLSGEFPEDILSAGLHQYGYDVFLKTAATFGPSASVPVGPDYIIGPGDQFTLTLWGTTEGIYTLLVTKEGNVTLPKVGVIPVAGVRFGELERTLRRHLSKYYSNFNLSVAMGDLKTITVYVVGEVSNPGSYSLHALTTAYGALFAAGGPTKKGTMRSIQVLRSGKAVKTIDLYEFLLKGDRSQDMRLQHEDTVFVPLIGPIAGVAGTVYRPAIYELKGKESLSDLIETAGGIMPIALDSRLQVTRFENHEKKAILDMKVPTASPATRQIQAMKEPVQNMDVVSVFPVYDKVWDFVNLNGDVRYPGDFQWRPDLRLKEIIMQGQLLPTSDLRRAEVIRLTRGYSDREVLAVDLEKLLAGDETQDIALNPQDRIRVYTTFRQAERITLSGEVVRPGTYEIQNGERLSDIIRRAGGFTPESYTYGTVFKRRSVKESQAKNMQSFITRVQAQVLQTAAEGTATALTSEEAAYAKAELHINRDLLANLKTLQEQQEGRVAITITATVDEWAGSKDDLLLQDGDSLSIPKRPQEVLVMGEIYGPGAQIFVPGMTVKDYIKSSGGPTKFAEEDQVFVVKANGYAFGAESPNGENIEDVKLQAGDAVFVPQKVERYAGMRFTKDIVDILFKTAVVIATITILF